MYKNKSVLAVVVLVLLLALTSVTLAQENQPTAPKFIKTLSRWFEPLQTVIQEKVAAYVPLSPAWDQFPAVSQAAPLEARLFVQWIQEDLVKVESALTHPLQTLHVQPVHTTQLTHITLPAVLEQYTMAQNGEAVPSLESLLHQLVSSADATT